MTVSDSDRSPESAALLDLRAAAERIGVHYMTAYRYVRLGRLPAERHGGRWWIRAVDVERLVAQGMEGPEASAGVHRPHLPSHRRRLRPVLLAGDESAAWHVCQRALTAGVSPSALLLQVVAPLLRSIGADCARERVTVAHEHMATAVAIRMVSRLAPLLTRRGRPRGTVVAAGVAGNTHVLPVMLIATILRGEGFAVTELGGDTPAEAIVAAAKDTDQVTAVALSVSTDDVYPAARQAADAIRRALPRVWVFVGGPAVPSERVAIELGGHRWASQADELARQLTALVETSD